MGSDKTPAPERDNGFVTAREVEATGIGKEMRDCLLLKVVQSVAERKPDCEAVEVACVQVSVEPDPTIIIPVVPEVANVYAV